MEAKDMVMSKKEFIIAVCGNCYMKTKWTDEECRICQSNMMLVAKAKAEKSLKALESLYK